MSFIFLHEYFLADYESALNELRHSLSKNRPHKLENNQF